MKKILALSLTLIMCLTLVLAGCSKKNNGAASESPSASSASPSETTPAATETASPSESSGPVTIKWATWMGQEDVERVIKAFEATHPNIKVEKDTSVDWPWNEKLSAVAAAGQLPDVMWTFGVPFAAANGWLEDLTPFLEKDIEYQEGKTFKNLDATANYNGKQYALVHSLFMFAINLNLDLFEKENVPVPPVTWTVDDMRDAAIKLTKFNEHQFGMSGIGGLRETLPAQFDPNLQWNTWDGEKFNFTSPAFKEAVDYVDGLMYSDKVTYDIYKPEEIEQWFGKDQWPWMLGKVAMQYDGTWSIGGNSKNAKFKWDIRPIPSAVGQKVPLITDYLGMSKSSKNKEAAFEFIKWVTYSKEGWMERLKPEWPLGSVPLINDQEVWDLYLNRKDMPPGMKDLVKMIPDGFVDLIKYLPGYQVGLDTVYGPTFKDIKEKKAKLEDVAADLEKRMNTTYKEANEQLMNAAQ
ncbi:ABC transporter substrate-binding protein [Cohnella luojiensis]|uniref:Extracellular solute-binding protein n=1 Tax=Cohnella luojiensis TaxID=652876 RepID=A0A4Y8LXY4_9BACL|nr:extracellular solute-binding protein [Cohnella luojiensis]TFE26290.1 extracellular solute-binding protein [Cohnella luojiensis]